MTGLIPPEGAYQVILDVLQVFLPLLIFFFAFQVLYLKLPIRYIANILKGVLLTFFGMILFIWGINIAFLPLGTEIGACIGGLERFWLLIPFGFLMGFLATFAEPAVRVLSRQIEDSSGGYIKRSLILYTLSLGVAFFVALGMAKIVYGIPFQYIVIPGYLLALILLRLSDRDFIAIAFDSGGVASGPMAVTFLMSMAVGAAAAIEGRSPIPDGFGMIALIMLAPVLSVMLVGILFRLKGGRPA
ncbi:MAG: DUF1538 domain-containing protein [Methanomicrobiaceae archaeon]|nr:DUF1538 domain-containing protein [Methanomicrobiaceae archaeon]